METLKTSDEWQNEMPEVLVYDPDGWNRSNFVHAWFVEKITKEEYLKRRSFSTCAHKNTIKTT